MAIQSKTFINLCLLSILSINCSAYLHSPSSPSSIKNSQQNFPNSLNPFRNPARSRQDISGIKEGSSDTFRESNLKRFRVSGKETSDEIEVKKSLKEENSGEKEIAINNLKSEISNESKIDRDGKSDIKNKANNESKIDGKSEGGEEISLSTYVFGKDGELDADLAMLGTSRRTVIFTTIATAFLALGANFLGITSSLLSIVPLETVERGGIKLDVIYPVRGLKRYIDRSQGFEFLYPKDWLQDQAILLARSQEPILRKSPRNKRLGQGIVPEVGFGPANPKGDGKENVSVIKQKLMSGFRFDDILGSPKAAGERLLSTVIAPKDSGKEATLLAATSELRGSSEVYELEYLVKGSNFFLHNLSVIAYKESENLLYTFTVVYPEKDWDQNSKLLYQVAKSFQLKQ